MSVAVNVNISADKNSNSWYFEFRDQNWTLTIRGKSKFPKMKLNEGCYSNGFNKPYTELDEWMLFLVEIP